MPHSRASGSPPVVDTEARKMTLNDDSSRITINPKFKHIWRKIDIFILPLVTMIDALYALDRTNYGNARIAGLQKDLNMTNAEFSLALTFTFIPYILMDLPVNLILKVVGPNIVLPAMLTLGSIVTTFQGLVKSYKQLLACRFLLGLVQGGMSAAIILYLSLWYPRDRLQQRIGVFTAFSSLSGAFSGLLAFTPSIVAELGFTATRAQLFSAPPVFLTFIGQSSGGALPYSISLLMIILAVLISSYLSDRFGIRGLVIMVSCVIMSIGLALYLATSSLHVKYGSLFLIRGGFSSTFPALQAWITNNTAPFTRRATALSISTVMINLGGIFSTWLFGFISKPPFYKEATIVFLFFTCSTLVIAGMNLVYLSKQNAKKAMIRATHDQSHGHEDEEPGLGDQSAWFVYAL
ncbi:hypothetical protein H0H93_014728 [Arthromyces matolae]|nr:hypothetical protein H0H93_014728 [Arthromyces matolae]